MRTILTTLLFLACVPAFATYTGLVAIPSTDVVSQGVLHLDVDTITTTDAAQTTTALVGLEYGVTPRLEAGIDAFNSAYPLNANAKYQLLAPSEDSPFGAAVGIFGVNPSSDNSVNVIYAVGSVKFAEAARFTAGAFTGDDDVLTPDEDGFFAGVEYTTGPWWLAADYISGDSALGSFNLGVGHPVAENVGLILQYTMPNADNASNALGLQVDINF
jgi:hypothetical protein